MACYCFSPFVLYTSYFHYPVGGSSTGGNTQHYTGTWMSCISRIVPVFFSTVLKYNVLFARFLCWYWRFTIYFLAENPFANVTSWNKKTKTKQHIRYCINYLSSVLSSWVLYVHDLIISRVLTSCETSTHAFWATLVRWNRAIQCLLKYVKNVSVSSKLFYRKMTQRTVDYKK